MPIKYIGKIDRYTGKTLFEILSRLKNYGVGRMITRNSWDRYPEPSYFIVKKAEPFMIEEKNLFGKVWVDLVFRGKREGPEEIKTPYRPDYRLISKEDEEEYLKYEVKEPTKKILPKYRPMPPLMKMVVEQQKKLKGEPVDEDLKIESVYKEHRFSKYQAAEDGQEPDQKFAERVQINPKFLEGIKPI